MKYILSIIISCTLIGCSLQNEKNKYDVIIIGGGASGVAASLQATRMGSKTLLIEETAWLGGMLTAAGVSAIDGNYNLPAGIWGEFREALANYYGGLDALKTGWVSHVLYEPSVGEKILSDFTQKENLLTVWRETAVKQLAYNRNKGWTILLSNANKTRITVEGTLLIDATELGDIAKKCGVKYDIGMESKKDTHEDIAPEKANTIIQDLTYVAILKDYHKKVALKEPEGYDPKEFACACANKICITPKEPDRVWSKDKMITYGKLPQDKYMINWPIEGNDFYVNLIEMTPEERGKAITYAKQFTLRFVYFIQHELRYNTLGLADDEYPTADLLPFIPYHRESRRIHGKVRFTLNDVVKPYQQAHPLYRTSIAVGDYPVDHHHTRYHGYEELPDLYFHPIPSYGLPLGTLIPQKTKGLIVAEKSISVSNIINGTTRLQPVVLQIGQAAGALAALAVKNKVAIEDVKVREVQQAILNAKGYLLPYLDVAVGDPLFQPLQRIGATGILKGVGRNVEWANQTWLRADTCLLADELAGLQTVYPMIAGLPSTKEAVTIEQALSLIQQCAATEKIRLSPSPLQQAEQLWKRFGWGKIDTTEKIKRGQMALLMDQLLHPFEKKEITITGEYIHK
ncbi:MAG: FAD-dependent oxidoreductase [Bacteroidaceae bacterium]